jgi:hypothetical protein
MNINDTFDIKGYELVASAGIAHGGGNPHETVVIVLCNNSSHYLVAIGNDSEPWDARRVRLLASFNYAEHADEIDVQQEYVAALRRMVYEAERR